MIFDIDGKQVFYSDDRAEWRRWLEQHYETSEEIWFAFPTKASG